jgi:EAL domain-containing protein (putative c-di-GMP-specific phosphodiesterase class I)
MLLNHTEATINMLLQIRARKIQLSIDDFGKGYSSLSYLHRFPINTLKIDRSFVSQMNFDTENFEIARTITTLAHTLGMDVIAEGVETDRQFAQLKALGCEFGQGYLFSKPLDSKAAESLLIADPQW